MAVVPPASATLKLTLLFWDRKQIVEDIAKVISANDLNILSMEVENRGPKVQVYIETHGSDHSPPNLKIIGNLKCISGLIRIAQMGAMPQEIREQRLEALLNSISDGILSIDRSRSITFINPKAKKMYGLDPSVLNGQQLSGLGLDNQDLLNCLNGKTFRNKKRNIITPRGRFQFFSTGIAVRDGSGEITGAIEIMRDMKQVKEMAKAAAAPSQFTFSDIIGQSTPLMDAISFAQKIAPSASVVSIRGESGTGKELFAKAIHAESGRSGQFVAVNCAALPESLLESELFGYESGTFTGAEKKGKQGLFEVADNGTLFLDEIADMPLGAQAKILRVIQEKQVRRIGGVREIPVNTRIITATSRLIEEMIEQHKFREDLYYRINVLPIHVPPLKDRPGDIPALCEHFLSGIAQQVGSAPKKLSSCALEKLSSHFWPGNVRELKNVIERGAILSDSETIDAGAILFGHEIETTIRKLRTRTRPKHSTLADGSLKQVMGNFEKNILKKALAAHPSIRKAAKALGISHTAMINKMKKFSL